MNTPADDIAPAPGVRGAQSAGHVAIALTVALLGFLLATQLRAQQGLADRLKIERESDLGQILGELTARNDQLLEQIVDLRVRLAGSTGSEMQERVLEDEAAKQLAALRIMLGTVPVTGPGIQINVRDPQGTVGPEVLLDAVQELRDAGAEAIAIGDVRVVVSTSFSGEPGAVRVAGRVIAPPYEIAAIGAPGTLSEAMRIPGGVVDSIGAHEGATVRIAEHRSVNILSVSKSPSFTYARPRQRR